MTRAGINRGASIQMLNRFYTGFAIFFAVLLCVGVPFVFVKKLPAALLLGVDLVFLLIAWLVNQRGRPKESLVFFSVIIWIESVAVVFAGLPPNGAALGFAVGLMLCVIVSQRAGLVFGISYLAAWLLYIVLRIYHLAPEPFFPYNPLTGWVIVAGASWLILTPIPQLVAAMNRGSALQRSVFEATSDALLVVDLAGNVESYNQQFIEMWNIPDDLASHQDDARLLEFVLTQLSAPDAFLDRVSEIYKQKDVTSFDTVSFQDGRIIERHSHPNSVGGNIVGRVWSFRDVTESYQAQDELSSSQSKLQALFDMSPLGMARNDMDGKFHEMNPALCRMLGYTPDEFKALSYWQITPHSYSAAEALQLERLQTQGTYGPYEKEYIHKAGHTVPVRLNGMLIQDSDGEMFIWSIIEDISVQKAHEQSLTEARKTAEEASRSKSEFLANMSHEIRTPMNAILGMLQLLENTQLSATQFDYMSKSQGAARSLLGLLNDILDLSKIDAGKMELEVLPFPLERLMRDLAVVLSANVGTKKVEVLYDIDPKIPALLVGDSMRLQQVLTNLGGNAIKFTNKGQIVVSVHLAETDGEEDLPPGHVRLAFAVQDTGIGIAAQNQERIFSDFSQAESSTTRRYGGTGLGLAITKRLVELMGSHIALQSEQGVGSTFSFALTMPYAMGAATGTAAGMAAGAVTGAATGSIAGSATAPQTAGPGGTAALASPAQALPTLESVLIIDDEPATCALIAKLLRAYVRQVDVAQSGQEALDLVHARHTNKLPPYDCVYVDWQMPQMDGWETTRRLIAVHQELAQSRPKIAMLSANGRQYLSQRTREEQDLLGAFLVKPVTASMLLEAATRPAHDADAVRKVLRSSQRQLNGMRILVVEDNAINQQVAEELLGFEGALVSIAADGQQGVMAVASAKPQFDAVLMDIQMPIMDGYAATQAIRKELGLVQLPIIGLTANAMTSDRDACLRAGMNEHVGKPFQLPQLVSILIRLTGRSTAMRGQEQEPVSAPPHNATHSAPHGTPPNTPQAPPQTAPRVVTQAVPSAEEAPVDTLAQIPLIDVPAALQRLGGMRSLYVKAARQFDAALDSLHTELHQFLTATDWQQAILLLHTSKGNAATLGLLRLSQALRDLELYCKPPGDQAQALQLAEGLPDVIASARGALQQAVSELDAQG